MIRTSYDPEADALFVWFASDATKSAAEEVAPGILLDFDASGRAIGIEVLDVGERLGMLHQSEGAKAAGAGRHPEFGAPRPITSFS